MTDDKRPNKNNPSAQQNVCVDLEVSGIPDCQILIFPGASSPKKEGLSVAKDENDGGSFCPEAATFKMIVLI